MKAFKKNNSDAAMVKAGADPIKVKCMGITTLDGRDVELCKYATAVDRK